MRVRFVLGSVVAHVLLLHLATPNPAAPRRPTARADAAPIIEVTVLPDVRPSIDLVHVPPTRADAERRSTTAGGQVSANMMRASTDPVVPIEPRGSEPTHELRMRYPDLRPSEESLARIAAQGSPRSELRASGLLDGASRGTAAIHDEVTTVTIDHDGTAHFHDRPDVEVHVVLPFLSLNFDHGIVPSVNVGFGHLKSELGPLITAWSEDPYGATRVNRTQDLSPAKQAVSGGGDAWGDQMTPTGGMHDVPALPYPGLLIFGDLDVTAMLMRKTTGDPYASRKLHLLDATRDERVALGAAYRTEQLDRSSELVRRNLVLLWDTTPDPAARREALFEMWDECGEGDDELGRSGQRARAMVVGWIRAHVPATSPDAFRDDEIAAMQARRVSRQQFEPYE